jgi:MFS family permease
VSPKRSVFILSLAIFATMVGNTMVVPFLPLYVHQFGVGEFGAGMLFSIHAATRLVVLPFVGRLSDRWERKSFLLVGVLCYTLASLAYLPAGSFLAFILVMFIHGTATAVVHPVAMAYVGDLAPKGQEGQYSGYINTALLGGIAGGPMIGGVLKDLFGMSANFWTMAGLSSVSLALLFICLPEVHGAKKTSVAQSASLREMLACPPLAGVSCFRFSYALGNALIMIFLPLLAGHLLTLSTTAIGFLIAANVLVSTLLQAPSGRSADRINKAYLIGLGGLGSAIALLMFPLATGFWHLLLLNISVGISFGIAFPAHSAVAIENAQGYGMGAVMSMLFMAHGFGMMIGPMLFGFIAGHSSLGVAFWGGGLICAALTVMSYPLMNRKVIASPASITQRLVKESVVTD